MRDVSLFSSVEIAVRCLEDDPTFNAGHGSSLNAAGQIEMDAIIMDGSKKYSQKYPKSQFSFNFIKDIIISY